MLGLSSAVSLTDKKCSNTVNKKNTSQSTTYQLFKSTGCRMDVVARKPSAANKNSYLKKNQQNSNKTNLVTFKMVMSLLVGHR